MSKTNISIRAALIDDLAKVGKQIVEDAQRTKAVGNRSYNQADAFGYVIYDSGKAVRKGYATSPTKSTGEHHGWKAKGIKAGTGRDWLNDFVDKFNPPKEGLALLVVNAAFYSNIHETKYNYKVISQTFDKLNPIKDKFKGASISIIK